MTKSKKMLVTCALPYANGEIHLGHMFEHIQADIWVRFQRMIGNEVYFICADDAHGTPIMLKANQLGISPEEMIAQVKKSHLADLSAFNISYDNYHSTHSKENQFFVEQIYQKLKSNNFIFEKKIAQLFDEEKQMFLPDRFVKGTCPKCNARDQYGDNCEVCSATYSPTELINPRSVLSNSTPVLKESTHFFFDLPQFEEMLKNWIKSDVLQNHVANKLLEWFENGLQAWDISRDAPYFGFEIPNEPGKYFYVWLDAPVGYMASFKNFCDKNPEKNLNFDEFWQKNSNTNLYHFIGKDIVYFHSLFWPAMLDGAELRKPTKIFVHGYVTINGEKMSKSRGTFIEAKTYLNHFDSDPLRYYFATKTSNNIDDIDLNLIDFVQRINSDLVNKIVNLASRNAGFIHKFFDGKLSDSFLEPELFAQFIKSKQIIESHYDQLNFSRAIREIIALADNANRYIDEKAPWNLAKQSDQIKNLHKICSLGINLFAILITYLKPILPDLTQRAETFLNLKLNWQEIEKPLFNHKIAQFTALMQRIETKNVENLLNESKKIVETNKNQLKDKTENVLKNPILETISFDDFAKIDLRVAKIEHAEFVEGSDKLLKISLDLNGIKKQVFSGIREAYPNPEKLIGKLTIFVANLAPRKMRFGVSEGMIIAAGEGKNELFLLSPDKGAKSGMKIN